MDGFAGDMLSGGRALLGEDSSVMARMQKKFWKTKQVLIKATGKKEDEHVVASDADLDAKLEFFRSVQTTCTELLKVIEKYQQRITRLSQEENELGLFLRFQAERDRTKAGNMMDATSKALCAAAKQRMALCPPLQRMHQEVETFRRRAIADTLLTVGRMEKARTEYRGALLWMKDVSQELDPDTYKQLEKFRKVQVQVRGTKTQFDRLKNDVCQKVDMLGASRCNMLSHSLCTYQTTLLQFWEKTAHTLSGIHEAFLGHVPYQFTTLKDLRDPLEQISDSQNQEEKKETALQGNTDSFVFVRQEGHVTRLFTHNLVSLDDEAPSGSACDADLSTGGDGRVHGGDGRGHGSDVHGGDGDNLLAPEHLANLFKDFNEDPLLMACDPPADPPLQPQLLPPMLAGDQLCGLPTSLADRHLTGGGLSPSSETGPRLEEEDGYRGDMAFLQDLLSPGPGASDEFSREWQDAFGMFEPPSVPEKEAESGGTAARRPSNPPSPTGFLPSQLLDHSLNSTGWVTPPMFQAPPLQPPPGQNQPAARTASSASTAAPSGGYKDMSAWFNLFADLDPLSNPDAIGRSADELHNA